MNISILHLSDLHIVSKNGAYSEVLKNLIDDIKKQCTYLKHIILVITGDLIDQAKFTQENTNVAISFFNDLQKAIGDKIVGVELVPGNHDREHNDIISSIIEDNRENINLNKIESKSWNYYLVSYQSYISLANEIRLIFNKNSKKINNTYYVETIDEINFKVIFINLDTSWASLGGSIDKRKLCIDETQLNGLKEMYQKEKRNANKKYITVMAAHHPLNWLKEKDEAFINSWLLNSEYFNIDFYLCGHTHDRQIKSFFDMYKSYITLVTGIGWDEKTAEEQKDKHRYSLYELNLSNNSCEITIRKTCADGTFDYDNDVLLTNEEKEDKKIYLPLNQNENKPKIEIPVFRNENIFKEYLFIDKNILEKMKKISQFFYDVSSHMALFQATHIRDFFDNYELHKSSKGTITKSKVYDDYFYNGMQDSNVSKLFENIKNNDILFTQLVSFLRELCGTIVRELKNKFCDIEYMRLHFRKYYKTQSGEHLYIAFCQAISEKDETPPTIRDLNYDSMIKIAFEKNKSLVYIHNKEHNPLPMKNDKYENFITMSPNINSNIYTFKEDREHVTRPFLSASLSIRCKTDSNILDVLNYMDISSFIFKIVFDYVELFRIDMEKFINSEVTEE